MTSPAQAIIDQFAQAGANLALVGGRIEVSGKGKPPRELMEQAKAHKGEIISLLAQPAPRAVSEALGAVQKPPAPAIPPSDGAERAARAVKWGRERGVVFTVTDEGRTVLSGDTDKLTEDVIARLLAIAPFLSALLIAEKNATAADRARFKNSSDWTWPDDLPAAIRMANERNAASSSRGEHARYCVCGRLGHAQWATNHGRLWLCDPCRDAGVSGLSITPPDKSVSL